VTPWNDRLDPPAGSGSASRALAVIPARGGSKGVPGKNLRRIGGRSLLARAVAAARGAVSVDIVVVSTDDHEIAAEARRCGAEVVIRPQELADDMATSESALAHALETLKAGERRFDVVAFLQCTSPFTTSNDVDAVLAPVIENRADSSFSAVPFHGFLWSPSNSGASGVNHDYTIQRQRRQDRPTELLETGAVYAFTRSGFEAVGRRFFGHVEAVELDNRSAVEIDTLADLELAQRLAAELHEDGDSDFGPHPPALVALDFDGVFTNNTVHVDENGIESVTCHRGDGHGLAALLRHVPVVVFSTEMNPVVSARCAKLGIECVQGLGDSKRQALTSYAAERGIDLDDVIFVGNDVNDLECLRAVGTPVAVADAVPEVIDESRVILTQRGGDGALRELSDRLLPFFGIQQPVHDGGAP
jgi:YrbI family 3-deoxy-D-manno-octulosonate 8-phosphate phosphatase